jgi:hypothetical protein
MGEVLQLPKRKKSVRQTSSHRGFATAVADPTLRAALLTLYENDEHLARVTKLTLMEVFKRLDTLEALVFAQSVLIAELRGQPLTPQQRAKISGVLKRKGKKAFDLE